MNGKVREWRVMPEKDSEGLRKAFPSRLVRQLLINRGIDEEAQAQAFLHPDYRRDLHDPFLFSDMEKGVARVMKALAAGEGIAIHGDYDADGVCASAIIASTLEFLGVKPYVHLPHRMKDGYGLKPHAVDEIARQGATLLITADCGISNYDAIAYAQLKGIDTVVVDHHTAPQGLPPACAIIHCNLKGERYPFRFLSAGGVAFKFAQAMLRTARITHLELTERNVEAFEKWLLDLVAISTVADVMPLVGENRVLVHYGLQVLTHTKRIGLRRLLARAGLASRLQDDEFLTARNIAFHIAPRLNAAGRIEHALLAYDLLRTTGEEEAGLLAERLESANKERQRLTDIMLSESIKQVEASGDTSAISVYGEGWSVGLVGLVAGKLSDQYGKPAFVIGTMNDAWTGSCRGGGTFNCMETLGSLAHLLDHWGGHAHAAGFTLKKDIDPEFFSSALVAQCTHHAASPSLLSIDAHANFEELDDVFSSSLLFFAPFGEGNPTPLLLTRNAIVVQASKVGKSGQHTKCLLMDSEGDERKAIAFGSVLSSNSSLQEGVHVDIVYEPVHNTWNGTTTLELYIRDVRYAE